MGKHRKIPLVFHICKACNSALAEDVMVQKGRDWYCADWAACVGRQSGGRHRKPKPDPKN